MKPLYLFLLIMVSILSACNDKKENGNTTTETAIQKADVQQDTIKKSIPKEATYTVNGATIALKYHAPAVRGRSIWSGLVPYGDVWVTGAHKATSFEIDEDFIVNDQKIPAGKYALFTIPDKDQWTFIINKNWEQHLTDEYNQADDVIRVTVKPAYLNENQERLKYLITSNGPNVILSVQWEKIKIELPFTVQ